MTSRDTTGHNAGGPGSVESWLVSAGRDRRPGSPLNVPPCPASNFVLGERRAYSRDDGTPGWEALEEIVGGLEGGSSVSFASGMAGIAAIFDQLPTGSVVAICLLDLESERDRRVPRNPACVARTVPLGGASLQPLSSCNVIDNKELLIIEPAKPVNCMRSHKNGQFREVADWRKRNALWRVSVEQWGAAA